jgi:hypothetical protein
MKKYKLFLLTILVMSVLVFTIFAATAEAGWTSGLPKSVIKTARDLRPYYEQFQAQYIERYNRTIQQDAKNLQLINATLVGNLAIVEYTLNDEPQTMITTIK